MTIGLNMTVTVEFTCKTEDGILVDESKHYDKPFKFVVGNQNIMDGFNTVVQTMEVGEHKVATIPPEEAFGKYDEFMKDTFKIDEIPNGRMLAEQSGKTVYHSTEDGMEPVTITDNGDGTLTMDYNHPLAGKNLILDITVLDAVQAYFPPDVEDEYGGPAFPTE